MSVASANLLGRRGNAHAMNYAMFLVICLQGTYSSDGKYPLLDIGGGYYHLTVINRVIFLTQYFALLLEKSVYAKYIQANLRMTNLMEPRKVVCHIHMTRT